MAVRDFVHRSGTRCFIWSNLRDGDEGAPLPMPGATYMSVQVFGDFGVGGVLVLQGSLEEEALNYFQMKNNGGGTVSFKTAGGEMMVPAATYVRPKVVGGDDTTDLTMILLARSAMR